jgi:NADH-quinone oxidoreductase subunit E
MQQDIAHAVNLFAHPMAGFAAASAMGMGLATQAWGLWFGAVAGAMEHGRRLSGQAPASDGHRGTVAAVKARLEGAAAGQPVAREAAGVVDIAPRIKARDTVSAQRQAQPEPARAASRPGRPDDLKKLPGVGPKMEQVLNRLGVWTFAQIAAWSDEDVARVEQQLGLAGRIARDGWVARAAELGAAARPRQRR